jgi:hypothetical protein
VRQSMQDNEHIVEPSSSIVETIDWLAAHGFTRAWYLHGRNGSAVVFQDSYRTQPWIAAQGDKLLFRQENEDDKGYIVITQPESDDDQSEGARSPANMIESGGRPIYHPALSIMVAAKLRAVRTM